MPWLNSNLRLWLGPQLQEFHQQREQTEKNVSVARRKAYRACTYFIFPTNPGELPLAPSCMSHIIGTPVWSQLLNQSDFRIIPRWGRHILYPIQPSPDVHPTLIFCVPDGLGIIHVHREWRRIVVWGRGARPTPHYDVQRRALCVYCIYVR